MSSNNSAGGCCGCLVLLLSIPVLWFVGHQNYSYQSTGQFDWSLPRIKLGLPEFGTPKSVQLCADYLKETSYADRVSIEDRTITFFVEEKGIDFSSLKPYPDSTSAAGDIKYWNERPGAMWNVINKHISNDIKSRCQAPVTANYTYYYVKKRFTGQVNLRD
jgi:hypothetical protein